MNEKIFLILLIIFASFTWFKFSKHRFNYPKDRPHKRYCIACGQEQIEVHHGEFLYDAPLTHWEDNGKICDENCHCHDYTNC